MEGVGQLRGPERGGPAGPREEGSSGRTPGAMAAMPLVTLPLADASVLQTFLCGHFREFDSNY